MQVGAVLLFAVLILGLTIYQASIVPQQNKNIEFNHHQEVQQDMVETRNTLLSTAVTGEPEFATVDLGTTYPPRIFAVNPGPPSGTLRTTDAVDIAVVNGTTGTEITGEVCPSDSTTRFLEYDPNYNAYTSASTVVYENTVVYQSYEDGGDLALTGQRLVDEDTVTIIPLTQEYSRSGIGTASVEPIPGYVTGETVTDPEIELPTRLSESTWEDLLQGEVDPANVDVSSGTLTLDLSGEYSVQCAPIGANSAPASGKRASGLLTDGDGDKLNPSGPDAVVLQQVDAVGQDEVDLTFENKDEDRDRTILRGRLSFYLESQNNEPTQATVQTGGTVLPIRGDYKVLNGGNGIEVSATDTETIRLTFDNNVKTDFFIFSVTFANGEQVRYFVQVPKN